VNAAAPIVIASQATALQSALPPLLVEAQRIAATVIIGIHGRKRAGPGETFWQYRPYSFGDSTQRIDWHKSARAERVFIRENEWEAANTLWLWASPSARMDFKSNLASVKKRERAMVLALALGELALRAHERVSALGSPFNPAHARASLVRMADWWARETAEDVFKTSQRLSRFSTVALFSDFLDPPELIEKWAGDMAARGVAGHLIQICDPAEETLPWNGRVEFLEMKGPLRYIAGKAESIRQAYAEKFAAQREAVRDVARRLGWSFSVHRTDESAVKALLTLHMLIGGAKSRVMKGG
jgi:uncharacterized protein (DUF58 family)